MKALCVDPGETTGWAIFEDWELIDAGQVDLWPFLDQLYACCGPGGPYPDTKPFGGTELIVCEDWAIYPWEAHPGHLDWDGCRTARGIGAIEALVRWGSVDRLALQAAQIKETAVAAGAEELFLTPRHENRHANDAIMHGVYYRLVGEGKAE